MAFCSGLNGTIETLVGQTKGDGKFYECGLPFNRCRVILTCIFVPITLVFFFADDILIALAQDVEISKMARDYVVLTLPAMFAIV